MNKPKYCNQGAYVTYPIGTIRRTVVGSPVCHVCPCYHQCVQVRENSKDHVN